MPLLVVCFSCQRECESQAAGLPCETVPEVSVMTVRSTQVPVTANLPGRMEAYLQAEVRARVTGIIQERCYQEGQTVRPGDLLFKIDPAPLQAVLDECKAAVARARAVLSDAEDKAARYSSLVAKGAVSIREHKQARAEEERARAEYAAAAASLEWLTTDEAMQKKYGVSGVAPLLFAVGDGNHSLATAKACYEEQKKGKTPEEYLALPARYALVEVVNNHDDALQFEPIHRVLFGVDHQKFMDAFRAAYPNAYEGKGDGHTIEFVWNGESHFITVPDPKVQLAVGTLQGVIDQYLKDNGGEVDYIHGDDVTRELGGKPGNMGFLLPAMGKEQLFKTVMADGVLPRKTFSMGHAQDKRYYIEARRITK